MRDYFLGGAAPSGYETSFWDAHKKAYGFYLKGGPGTGKSTLMKKFAAAFAGEVVSLYHCASDPRSLDAVVLEERGIFVADATAPHEASTPLPAITGTLIDLAANLHTEQLMPHKGEILRLYSENQAAHSQVRKGLAGIAAMEDGMAEIGYAALDKEKLRRFAERFAKRVLPKETGETGAVLYRQSTAITPLGRYTWIPEQYDLIVLQDPAFAASEMLLEQLAAAAEAAGAVCEVSRSQTRRQRKPVQLLFPAQQIAVVTAESMESAAIQRKPVSLIRMQRFYDGDVLRSQRNLLQFSRKTASVLTAQTVSLLADALEIHDDLEAYYIAALNPEALNAQTEALIAAVKSI